MFEVIDYHLDKIPTPGVCIGHQALGKFFAAKITKARITMHGKISQIYIKHDHLFKGLPERFEVVRCHSLILSDLPNEVEAIAFSEKG
jgi:anthranilate synthase component 2